MKILKHTVIVGAALFLMLGLPFFTSDYFAALMVGDGVDAVTSASVIIDQPSGNYVVLINLDRHQDGEKLAVWKDFFAGKEVSYIFEDIVCTVAKSDGNGLEMAESYQSRLPENQMKIRLEDGILMVSRAEYGKFDILIMSEEIADSYSASTLYDDENIAVIRI